MTSKTDKDMGGYECQNNDSSHLIKRNQKKCRKTGGLKGRPEFFSWLHPGAQFSMRFSAMGSDYRCQYFSKVLATSSV